MDSEIYLDNSATTRPLDSVVDYIGRVNSEFYGNPSSLHRKGLEAEKLVERAREIIAVSLGAERSEIYFTSGGTESNNLAIMGYLEANPRKGKHIITTAIEHPSVLEVYRHMETRGFRADYLGVDEKGILDLNELSEKICGETSLISIILVNNETGSIQPLEEIIRIRNMKNPGAVIHVDAVQAYGKIRLNPRKAGIGLLSVSSHKIHGPKGAGALYAAKGIKLKPVIFGGGQEALLRSGTENTAGICGFGLAAETASGNIDENMRKAELLKNTFLDELQEDIGDFRVVSPKNALPYILNIAFSGIRAEVLLHSLEDRGIYVSTGSACSSRKKLRSHVLTAMRLEECYLDGAVRFSFSPHNTTDEIKRTAGVLRELLPVLRRTAKRR